MDKAKYIPKRGNIFYYIEVWSIEDFRDLKLSKILGIKETKPKYYFGSSSVEYTHESLHCALFWKTQDSAHNRLRILRKEFLDIEHRDVKNHYIIKTLNREEFIKKIQPGKKYQMYTTQGSAYLTNINLRKKEIKYKKRTEQLEVQKVI